MTRASLSIASAAGLGEGAAEGQEELAQIVITSTTLRAKWSGGRR